MSNEPPNAPDLALLVAALWHVALGLAIGGLSVASGMGLFRLVTWRRVPTSVRNEFLYGFPLGIACQCGLSFLALASPAGRLAAPLLFLATIVPLFVRPGPALHAQRRDLLIVSLKILPFAFAFGTFMALLWHGPTATLAARPLGDMVYYAALVDTFRSHLTPIPNLAVLGDTFALSNSVPSIMAAAVSLYLPIDTFLYLAGWGAGFYVLTFALSLFLTAPGGTARPLPFACAFAFLLASLYDPNWMVNSIPAAITFPLFFLAWHILRQPGRTPTRVTADALIMIAGSALAKVTAAIILVPLVVLSARSLRLRDLSRRQTLMLAGTAILGTAYVLAMLIRFGPTYWAYFVSSGAGPFSYQNFARAMLSTITWQAYFARDLGSVALIAAAVICLRGPLRLVTVLGAAAFLIYPLFFTVPLLGVTLLMGLAVLHDAPVFDRAPWLVLTAAALLLLATLIVDPGQFQTSVAWLFCMGGACLVALGRPFRPDYRFPAIGTAVLLIGLVAIASQGWRMTTGDRRPYAPRSWLTPAFRDIWLAVRERTPADALIFTDRSGSDAELQTGSDLLAIFSRRQMYVAGILESGLYMRKDAQAERLAHNRAVLDGRLAPQDLPDAKGYRDFYAVTTRQAAVPASWPVLYQNGEFRLMQIK